MQTTPTRQSILRLAFFALIAGLAILPAAQFAFADEAPRKERTAVAVEALPDTASGATMHTTESAVTKYLSLMFALVFVQNFVLAQFLGLCPFLGVSKKRDAAIGMGMAVVFVMVLACVVTILIYKGIFLHPALKQYEMYEYLDIVAFILVIAALVQFVEIAMRKIAPALYATLGIYLPLITTNCAILGATQMKLADLKQPDVTLGEALLTNVILGVFGGIGFTLALFLMAGIRERLEHTPIPESMKGAPIAFVCAAAMAMAFFGFAGFV